MKSLLLLLLLGLTTGAWAQPQVRYEISFPNAAHHEAEIVVTFSGVPTGQPLEVRMSRTSPGRYALHEFAKNVYNVHAFDSRGEEVEITRPNPYQWDVTGHDGTVRFHYTLFADRTDGTYSGIDNTHAHLNIPATFAWARGLDEAPVTVTFFPPDPDWKVATQLFPTDEPRTFTAPNFQYFMDSPVEISDFERRTWMVSADGVTRPVHLIVHHTGTDADVDRYAEMAEKVTHELVAVFGAVPENDNGSYTFLADYLPWANGDGMEHRNSTVLTSSRPLAGQGALANLGTLSHEYIHQWNVERIRPASLEPFDFEEANMSGELWFAEGFTSYYDDLAIRRAGLYTDAEYAQALSGGLNFVLNSPGRNYFSPVEMSHQAPFTDAATSIDPQNKQNTFISYYTWGSVIGLGLDLTLRSQFNRTLDDYMQAMWRQYGEAEIPYTMDDLKKTLADLTEAPAFADAFFARYVEGRDVMDYAALLAHAGFLLRKAHPGQPTLGGALREADGQVQVAGNTLVGSPLYGAGLDRGDVLLELDGRAVRSVAEVEAIVQAREPGDTLPVRFRQRGEEKAATLTLQEDPTLEVVPLEETGPSVTPAQRRFRADWLGSKAINR